MNDASLSAGPTARQDFPEDLVQVVLDTCSASDADTVLRTLSTRFTAEHGGETPRQDTSARPDTWTGTFLVSRGAALAADTSLTGPVTMELQGTPVAVDRLRGALASAFAVQVSGSSSGDQEVDLQLRVANADDEARAATSRSQG